MLSSQLVLAARRAAAQVQNSSARVATRHIRIVPTAVRAQERFRAVVNEIEAADKPIIPAYQAPKLKPAGPQALRDLKVGFIGWGNMAQAVSLGLVRGNLTLPHMVMATDLFPPAMEAAKAEGLRTAKNDTELTEWADIVVMAVKPQVVDPVAANIAKVWKPNQVLVSICAGVSIDSYKKHLGEDAKVIRVMANTPCLIGQAATAYDGSDACEDWELELIHGMFAAVGKATHRVPEYLLNAVTGVSGSGPAYVYMMIQAMSDAGVHGGLPRNVAQSLAVQTIVGAARMVQETGLHPAVLKEAVTSPAGTTIAGVRTLEAKGFNTAVIEAVGAAISRAEDLSRS